MENLYTQKNLEKLLKECYAECKTIGLTFREQDIKIKKGHTTGTNLGLCHYNTNRQKGYNQYGYFNYYDSIESFDITIYDHEKRDLKGIKETILHELIHTKRDCQNHRSTFKNYCYMIQYNLGYSCLSGQHNDCQTDEYKIENYKHYLICPHCNKITSYSNRYTRPYQHPELYHHRACKTTLIYANCLNVKEKLGMLQI